MIVRASWLVVDGTAPICCVCCKEDPPPRAPEDQKDHGSHTSIYRKFLIRCLHVYYGNNCRDCR